MLNVKDTKMNDDVKDMTRNLITKMEKTITHLNKSIDRDDDFHLALTLHIAAGNINGMFFELARPPYGKNKETT
jgi:hypothetical protein